MVSTPYRPDRDKYVRIQEQFVKPDEEHNFAKRKNTLTFGLPYDGLSIMHYESYYFSVDGFENTIVSKVMVLSSRPYPVSSCWGVS